jgi:hypothetical protein
MRSRRYERLLEDQREFTRECLMRLDRVLDANTRALIELTESTRVELRDMRYASNAQTQALLKVIDRMDRLDPGGAAA